VAFDVSPQSLFQKLHFKTMDVQTLCSALLEMSPFPMALLVGESHSILYTNHCFLDLFELPAESLVGKPFPEILEHKETVKLMLAEILSNRLPKIYRAQRRHKSNTGLWSYTIWPIENDAVPSGLMVQIRAAELQGKEQEVSEALLIGSIRQQKLAEAEAAAKKTLEIEIQKRKKITDRLHILQAELITKANQLETLVQQRTAELTETNKQLESFVYAIAHDLRAPLRAMQGFSAVLMAEAGPNLPEKAKKCAERINKSALFMDAMLIDLLIFSQISQQRLELSNVKLGAVIEAVLSRVRSECEEKNVIEERIGPWPLVLAHEPTLHQVLYNLTSNALKFVRPNIPPRLRFRTDQRPGIVRLWVEDNGIGIAPEHYSQLFHPFTRLNSEDYPGTGIGLAIVQKGVERMGGDVGLESVVGEGSRFWIELKEVPHQAQNGALGKALSGS
jgi:signal transduction histidine kinase